MVYGLETPETERKRESLAHPITKICSEATKEFTFLVLIQVV